MSSTFFQKKYLALAILFLCASLLPSPAHALGLSPPTVEVNDLLRDTTQTRSVTLYRAPDDVGDITINVQPDEDDAEFFVLEETDLVMLSGQTELSYEFGVTPGNAANGDYELKLRFLKIADSSNEPGENSVRVVTGVTAQILVTVGGEERLEYALGSMYALPTEEGLDTSVVYFVSNTGNVDWRPAKIVFAFFDAEGTSVDEYAIEGDEIESVRAGEENQSFTVNVPAVLTRGSYTVTAAFYESDDTVQTLETPQSFEVYAPGTLAKSGTLKSLSVNKEEFALGEKVKLSGLFENDGEVDLDVVLLTEISRDGQIIDLVRGNEYTVSPSEEIVLSELIDVDAIGTYQLSSYVEFANRQTASQTISFVVSETVAGIDVSGVKISSLLNSTVGLIGLVLALILFMILFLRLKRRKKSPPAATVQPGVSSASQVAEILPSDHPDHPFNPSGQSLP